MNFKKCKTHKDVNIVLGTMSEKDKSELLKALDLVNKMFGLDMFTHAIYNRIKSNLSGSRKDTDNIIESFTNKIVITVTGGMVGTVFGSKNDRVVVIDEDSLKDIVGKTAEEIDDMIDKEAEGLTVIKQF